MAGGAGSGEEAIQHGHGDAARRRRHGHQHARHGRRGCCRDHLAAAAHRPIIMMSVHGEAEQLKRSHARPAPGSSWSSRSAPTSSPPPSGGSTRRSSSAASRCRRSCRPSRSAAPLRRRATWASTRSSASSRPRAGPDGRPSPPTWPSRCTARPGGRVCLVDANLQFGDVGVLLNLNPKNRSDARRRRRRRARCATSPTRW